MAKDNEVIVLDQREKDIQDLCTSVLNAYPNHLYNPNGADETTCPFCFQKVYYTPAEISDIKHETNCAYNIAKDLSTNHK